MEQMCIAAEQVQCYQLMSVWLDRVGRIALLFAVNYVKDCFDSAINLTYGGQYPKLEKTIEDGLAFARSPLFTPYHARF